MGFSCVNLQSSSFTAGTAVEVFQDGQLVGPGGVGRAAGSDVLDVDGQAVAAIGGGQGAGVAPGVEDLIEQGLLVGTTGTSELAEQARQGGADAGRFAQAADLSRAPSTPLRTGLHVRQGSDGAGIQVVGKLAVEGILDQVDVAQVAADLSRSYADNDWVQVFPVRQAGESGSMPSVVVEWAGKTFRVVCRFPSRHLLVSKIGCRWVCGFCRASY